MNEENELQEKLTQVLSDPAAMSKIMSIAGALMGGSPSASDAPKDDTLSSSADDEAVRPPSAEAGPIAGNIDTAGLLAALTAKPSDDPRCALLLAIKPYLQENRRYRVDSLIRALKLAEITEKLFK